MKIKDVVSVFALSGFLLITGCGESDNQNKDEKLLAQNFSQTKKVVKIPTITEFTSVDKGFSIFTSAIKATGVSKMLDDEGAYTIFAPANLAFDRFSKETVEKWLLPENKEKLTAIVKCHIIPKIIKKEDIVYTVKKQGGSVKLKTLDGELITATLKGNRVFLIDKNGNGGVLITTDVAASNGVIHTIDAVMMPKK